jgi:uncharacterized membrane protein
MRVNPTFALLVPAFFLLLVSCKKDSPGASRPGGSAVPAIVTVLETENDSVLLWKNGSAELITTLPGFAESYTSSALAASGNTSYIAGFLPSTTSNVYPYSPVYWQNGVRNSLSDTTGTTGNGQASAVAVSGGDVYIAGVRDYFSDSSTVPFSGDNGNYPVSGSLATVWKNGTPVTLPGFGAVGVVDTPDFANRTRQDYVSGLFVSGNDVYVSGGTTWDVVSHAAYWKNGVRADLGNNLIYFGPTNSTGFPQTTSVYVSAGKDVYVTGTQTTIVGTSLAIYWKNGKPAFLSTDSTEASAAYAASVWGSDVYVAGWQNVGAYSRAMLWKNGVATPLTSGNEASAAYAMTIFGGDVYVAGYTWQQFGNYIATYWKNGVEHPITDGTNNAIAYAITVH